MTVAHDLRQWLRQWQPTVRQALPIDAPARHILVPPTGFGLFYAALMLVMALGALNYGNNPALMLVLLLAASGLISVLMAQRAIAGLRIQRISAAPVPAGECLTVEIDVLATDTRPRQGLFVQTDDGCRHALLDDGSGHYRAVLPLQTQHRGLQALPAVSLGTCWPLGLITARLRLHPPIDLLVHPARGNAPSHPQSDGRPPGPRTTPETGSALRDYLPGDPPSRIAWKASARRGHLMVTPLQPVSHSTQDLDWEALPALPHEARIVALAEAVRRCARGTSPWTLHLPGSAPRGPATGPQHAAQCLQALALMPPGH